jgi:hypothetical protein
MLSHIPVKMPFMPFQHCSQSPVNSPMKTSKMPRITSVTVSKMFAI